MNKIKIYGCRYVCEYQDGMPLSSSEHYSRTPEERLKSLKDYDRDELDIDTNCHEYGWEFFDFEI